MRKLETVLFMNSEVLVWSQMMKYFQDSLETICKKSHPFYLLLQQQRKRTITYIKALIFDPQPLNCNSVIF